MLFYGKFSSISKIKGIIYTFLLLCDRSNAFAQPSLQVRSDQWLQIEKLSGDVTVRAGNQTRPAKVGDRLQIIGDQIQTARNSSSVLIIDTAIGTIQVSENTTLRIHSLSIAPDNGRITLLEVTEGRVNLQVRRFNHRGSRLDIFTPAGVSGVRGTQFGINVQPTGKTIVSTIEGKVLTKAQNQSVLVTAGLQSYIIPGQPPSQPTPLSNPPNLHYDIFKTLDGFTLRIWMIGRIDANCTAKVNGISENTDRYGNFFVSFPATSYLRVKITITTPLGNEKIYEIGIL